MATSHLPQVLETQNLITMENRLSLLDVLQVTADHLRLLILAPVAVGLVALAICFVVPPTFTATAKFLPPQQPQSAAASMLQSLGSLGGLAGAATGMKNPADQYIAFLKTRAITDILVDRYKFQERYRVEYKQDARKELEENTKISSGKDNIITLEFDDKDPDFAARVANDYVQELLVLVTRLAVTEAQQRRVFFERLLGESKKELVKAEQLLGTSGVSASALNANPNTALEGPARLRAQVTAQEVRIASLRTYLTGQASELLQAQNELQALRIQLARAEREQPARNSESNDYITKFREFKYQETLFELLTKQYEMARIDESHEGAVQVIDVAQPPERKSRPKRALVAIGATLAALLGLICILIAKAWYQATQTPSSAVKIENIKKSFSRALKVRPSAN